MSPSLRVVCMVKTGPLCARLTTRTNLWVDHTNTSPFMAPVNVILSCRDSEKIWKKRLNFPNSLKRTKLTNSLGRTKLTKSVGRTKQLQLSTRTSSSRARWNRGKFVVSAGDKQIFFFTVCSIFALGGLTKHFMTGSTGNSEWDTNSVRFLENVLQVPLMDMDYNISQYYALFSAMPCRCKTSL